MTEIPPPLATRPSSYSFQTSRDSITIWTERVGYKIEVTDGDRDAYYQVNPSDVEVLNKVMGLPPEISFLDALAEIVKQGRADEFHKALYNNVKPEYVWMSGF